MTDILNYEAAYVQGIETVGGKAFNMARMARWGFNVPVGFAISTLVYDEVLARPAVANLVAKIRTVTVLDMAEDWTERTLKDLRLAIEAERLSETHMQQLNLQLVELDLADKALAIRSSATGEDGEKHAFAGIHESYLNVHGEADIESAVLRCFASLWTLQAVAYRRRFKLLDKDVRGAVLVCEMVTASNANEPVAAGVVFTADPTDGRRDVMVIEATSGMGDKLVNGEVTPSSIKLLMKVDGFDFMSEVDAPISKQVIGELAAMAWRLHWAFSDGDIAQDIEWAYDGEQIVILQVRPVTSLPARTYDALKHQPEIWTNGNFKEVLAGLLSPLGWSLIPQVSNERFFDIHHLSDYYEPQGMQVVKRFEGRPYVNVSIIQYSGVDAWGILPVETNKSFGGFQPEIELPVDMKIKSSKRSMALTKVLRAIWRGHKQFPQIFRRGEKLAKDFLQTNYEDLSKLELLNLWYSLGDEKYYLPFMTSNAMGSIWLGMARQFGVKYLPESELEPLIGGLMSGQGDVVSAQHAYDMHEIIVKHGKQGAEFEIALERWFERYGHRGYNEFDIANPRWGETKDEIRQYVQNLSEAVHSPESAMLARETAEQKLKTLGFMPRKVLGWLLAKARDGFSLRERGKSALIASLAMFRHISLAMAKQMVEQGVIDEIDDVFMLSFADIQAWATGVWDGNNARLLIADRKSQMNEWREMEAPADVLMVNASGVKQVEVPSSVDGNYINGVGVSPGVAKGAAVKLDEPTDAKRMKNGGILVARATDPSWTPLFLTASGIVVEIGGYLSHGAIVAREFGLPAVVNAAGSFDAINEGDELIVDGNLGRVEIVKSKNGL